MLGNLAELESASKILLGAHFRSKEINPLDYCYSALGISLNDLPKYTFFPSLPACGKALRLEKKADILAFRDGHEFNTLHRYIENTASGSLNSYEITNIFSLQRKGEPERYLLHFFFFFFFFFFGFFPKCSRNKVPVLSYSFIVIHKGLLRGRSYQTIICCIMAL